MGYFAYQFSVIGASSVAAGMFASFVLIFFFGCFAAFAFAGLTASALHLSTLLELRLTHLLLALLAGLALWHYIDQLRISWTAAVVGAFIVVNALASASLLWTIGIKPKLANKASLTGPLR